jgi:drug/metabolite transporter (DMT)-like permease
MSRPVPTAPGLAIAAVVLAAVLFGTSGTARELGPDSASSLSVGAARITIGSIVLWSVVLANHRNEPLPSSASVRPLRWLLAIGGVGVAVYTPLFFVAVDRAGVAIGTVVAIASGPFFGANREGHKVSQGMRDAFWFQGSRYPEKPKPMARKIQSVR